LSLLQRIKPFRFVGESRPCALCGGLERTVVGTRDRYWMPLRNVLCSHCGLVFLDPMPTADDIERYYRDEYREHYHGDSKPRAKALLRDERGARERVAMLAHLLRKGDRVLDIGAGTGAFVAAATAAGWSTEGIEPHQGFATFAREHYRARIHATLLEDAPLKDGEFDLITSSHVFEHLRTPELAFARVHRLLGPDGVFHVNVPDISDPRRTPNARWHFGHVHGFTRETLSMLAWRSGFDVLPESPPQGPNLLLRRLDVPVANWMRHPDHAGTMRRFFAEHTSWRHFTSATPYRRFFARMRRFSRERRQLRP
jgi:SAM-dependent methyltransferase